MDDGCPDVPIYSDFTAELSFLRKGGFSYSARCHPGAAAPLRDVPWAGYKGGRVRFKDQNLNAGG